MPFDPISTAIFVIAFALSYTQAKKAQRAAKKAADAFKGVLVNKESNVEPIPVIYGERRVGGTRVFVNAEGDKKNKYLFIALVLCEGEVEDISDIKIDDYSITDPRYNGVRQRKFNGVDVWDSTSSDLVYIDAYRGQDGQGISTILQTSSKWNEIVENGVTKSPRLSGVAYLGIRLRWDQDVFSGMPEITAVVKGKKVQNITKTGNPVEWSDNPALCLLDYLKNKRYGKGLVNAQIDLDAFKQAAIDCENSKVNPYSDGFAEEKIFRCNFVVDTGDRLFDNVQKFLLGMRGFIPYSQGKYSLVIDKAADPVMTLGINEIIGGINIIGESKSDKFNRVAIKFPNPEAEWQPDEAFWPDAGSAEETTFLKEDGNEQLLEEIDMEMITSYAAARDFARIFCLRSRNALRCQITATSEAMNLVPSDVVTINHPTPGWDGDLKPFQVEEMTMNFDGTVDLNLIEYDPSIYAYEIANPPPPFLDTDLPDPFDIDPPTNVSIVETTDIAADGTLLIAFDVTWVPSISSYVDQYEIGWYQSNTASLVFTDTLGYTGTTTRSSSYRISNLEEKKYVIGVRAISTLGARSDWAYAFKASQGDVTPPEVPENLTATGGFRQITLTWQNDTVKDLAYTEIKETTAVPDGGDGIYRTIAQVPAPGNSYVRTGLPDGVKRYYVAISYDYSGNRKNRNNTPEPEPIQSNLASAQTEFIDSDSFTDSVKQLFENAGLYAPEPYNTYDDAPLLTTDQIGKLIFIVDENKLYQWTADGWKPVVPDLNDAVGKITGVNIGEETISAENVKADFIAAYTGLYEKIDVGSLRVDNIAAGLAAFTGVIANSAMIKDAVVTNAKIQNLAVSTFKLGDNAVSIPEFSRVFNSKQSGSATQKVLRFIPFWNQNNSNLPNSYNTNHPNNYLTTMVLDFDWGAERDAEEIATNKYNVSLPPARIAAFADTVFQSEKSATQTMTTKIIAFEGDNQQVTRNEGANGSIVTWNWNIPKFRRITAESNLPASAVGLGSYTGYIVWNSNLGGKQCYRWNGLRWVRMTDFSNGYIVDAITTDSIGTPSSSVFVKWDDLNNQFITNGIYDISETSATVADAGTGQITATGFFDTNGKNLVSNSIKFAVLQKVSIQGDSQTRFAPFTSLLLLGTKK